MSKKKIDKTPIEMLDLNLNALKDLSKRISFLQGEINALLKLQDNNKTSLYNDTILDGGAGTSYYDVEACGEIITIKPRIL